MAEKNVRNTAAVQEDTSAGEEQMKAALASLIQMAAKNHNTLTSEDIQGKLAPFHLSAEQMESVHTYLESRHIDVLEMDDQDDDKEVVFTDEDQEESSNDELAMIENEEQETENEPDTSVDTSDFANTEDPVRMYLKEIGRVKLLTAEEEIEIAKRIEDGSIADQLLNSYFVNVDDDAPEPLVTVEMFDTLEGIDEIRDEKAPEFAGRNKRKLLDLQVDGKDAKNELAEANLRLVVSIAKKYVGRGMTFLDLIQEGNLGLMKAVEKFDYRKGFKFSTYATWWIRQAITRAIADQARTIRIPVHMVETINKYIKTTRTLTTALGREPTDKEVADEMGITEEKVSEIKQIAVEPVSLDTPVGDEEDSQIGDFVSDDKTVGPADAATYSSLKSQLVQAMSSLTVREQEVLRLRFGLDDGRARTLEEVGKEFGVTRERIRQIEAKALRKLRHPSRAKKLKDYLD